jgi:DNA invertase Pin-like site-specific DNA recombinase
MSTISDTSGKIRPGHLERAAYVYVRQSSPQQVEHHQESRRRQYALADWAQEAGWPRERIVIVDEDQGKSGASASSREGFGRLIASVGRGEVGVVVSLEASRLARNSMDWHHLVYLCRFTDTLIADEQTVYDPQLSADRMVLGIRGQVSELELDNSVQRMVAARWAKAERGGLLTIPPAGYEIDDLDQLVVTSDESVAQAIRTLFAKFDELGSGRQVLIWWRGQQMQFPVRRTELRSHPVVWLAPEYRNILYALKNPIYAGAHVMGRTETVRELDPDQGRVRVRRRVRKEWPVLIKNHHPGYISYEKFLEIQKRLRKNVPMPTRTEPGSGAVREGQALLQGLVRCGICGRKMVVSYGGHRASRTMQYRCCRARVGLGGRDCQTVGGKRVNEAVVEAFLAAVVPAGFDAVRVAEQELRQEKDALTKHWSLQLEKAEYEVQRAQRQYHAVEPENRLVARELERRWNARLSELDSVRARAQAAAAQSPPLSDAELAKAEHLGRDLEAVWHAESTTNRDRKRLLRCLIEEVQLETQEQRYLVRIVWKGGALTEREVVRHPRGGAGRATSEDTLELVRKLALEFDDSQIARILNKQGRRSATGNPFSKAQLKSLRAKHGIKACAKKLAKDPREGPFTADEAAAELGVTQKTLHSWLRDGVLAGQQATPGAPWRIVLSDEVRRRLSGADAPKGWVGLNEAAARLGLSKSHVATLVKSKKLKAVHTTVGKRRSWRIDVSSATCGRQTTLLEPTTSDDSKET